MRLFCLFVLLTPVLSIFAQDDGFSIDTLTSEVERRFVDTTINTFMGKYDIPGLSIAIASQGEIIFAKGYGYADRGRGRLVNVITQFRIASVSKSITAVAIMKLVEEGRLSLQDKVFGPQGRLSIYYPASNRFVEEITIGHLLEHTAAKEWVNEGNAPMFAEPHRDKRSLVEWVLTQYILSEPPGTRYAYSNLGYCILGLVIEEVTGKSCARYVQDELLASVNIRSFAIANNKPGGSFLEARYYPNDEADPYGFPVSRMDAHGGWIANAIDLVAFSLSVDGLTQPADILSPDSIRTMSAPSANNQHYALGWNVNQYHNRWHVGSMPGTAAILVRTEHGFSWAILMNKRSNHEDFFSDLDALPWTLINHIAK